MDEGYWLTEDKVGKTPLHRAATQGTSLAHVPLSLLCSNPPVARGDSWTLLHYAAEHGHLDKIPKIALTRENMLKKNLTGNTPLHIATRHGAFDILPRSAWELDDLLLKGRDGERPIFGIMQNFQLDRVRVAR